MSSGVSRAAGGAPSGIGLDGPIGYAGLPDARTAHTINATAPTTNGAPGGIGLDGPIEYAGLPDARTAHTINATAPTTNKTNSGSSQRA